MIISIMLETIIQKTTSRGQITLPKTWRTMFKTSQFLIKPGKNELVISPLFIKENGRLGKGKVGYTTIYNAKRDTKGQGIPADKPLEILKELNGQA